MHSSSIERSLQSAPKRGPFPGLFLVMTAAYRPHVSIMSYVWEHLPRTPSILRPERDRLTRWDRRLGCGRQLRKCHELETDLGDIVMRQPRTRRSRKINMSGVVRPYTSCRERLSLRDRCRVVPSC